jgi:hypothetical protein
MTYYTIHCVCNFINPGNVLELTVLFITNYKLRAITRRTVSNANTFPSIFQPEKILLIFQILTSLFFHVHPIIYVCNL